MPTIKTVLFNRKGRTAAGLALLLAAFYLPNWRTASLQAEEDAESLVVIQLADRTIRAGLAGEKTPRTVFPAVVGRPKSTGVMIGMGQKSTYIGDEALARASTLRLNYPIQNGSVTNWDDVEKILHYVFYTKLRVSPENASVLVLQSPLNSRSNREKLTQILFETFNVRNFFVSHDTVLALYAAGQTSGLTAAFSENYTLINPVYEGYLLMNASQTLSPGADVSQAILKSITQADKRSQPALFAGIVLVGAAVPAGIEQKIRADLKGSIPAGSQLVVERASDPVLAAWRGGSILANLSTFADMWITKDEYDEAGASIVHRKCN
ncbi:MAG: hypothetical protein KDK39_03160 [Leptospiraceae bacterium]|nr:hypothetical protein [Leptospiraceae bacterium]